MQAMTRGDSDEELLVAARRKKDKGKAAAAEAEIVYDEHKVGGILAGMHFV